MLNNLKFVFGQIHIIDELAEAYVINRTEELDTELQIEKDTLPEQFKGSDTKHMSRLKYYGRGRIGVDPDPEFIDSKTDNLFDLTRVNLQLLLLMDCAYQKSKTQFANNTLGDNESYQSENTGKAR
jgi:hypothetical protein